MCAEQLVRGMTAGSNEIHYEFWFACDGFGMEKVVHQKNGIFLTPCMHAQQGLWYAFSSGGDVMSTKKINSLEIAT